MGVCVWQAGTQVGGKSVSVYTLEEVGKIESTAVIYRSEDSEGGEVWLWVAAVRGRKVTNAICVWERQREIKVKLKVLSLSGAFDRNTTI